MTTPGRLLDFFTLEASEYLTRLESLVAQQAMPASDANQLAAAARGLRGSATMATASELARLATSVERIAGGIVQGATKWEPELQRSMVGAIEDLKFLVRSVRSWGAEQDARVEESLRRLARYGPAREARNDEVIVPISQLFYNDDGQLTWGSRFTLVTGSICGTSPPSRRFPRSRNSTSVTPSSAGRFSSALTARSGKWPKRCALLGRHSGSEALTAIAGRATFPAVIWRKC